MKANLRDSDDQVSLMECDLIDHCVKALNENDIAAVVDGVFSLDHLENLLEADLNGRIGVGVGYQGCKPIQVRANPTDDRHIANMMEFSFMVLIATPTDSVVSQRIDATKLLTVLRKGVMGKQIEVSPRNQRAWQFMQERPEIDESTPTMLYYTQVWRLLMPVVGT